MNKKTLPITTALIITLLSTLGSSTEVSPVQAKEVSAPLIWTLSFDAPIYEITALEVYNGKLYAGGLDAFQTNGRLYRFDGTTWEDMNLATQLGITVDFVQALYVFNNRLYIGVRVNIAGTDYVRVYYYDGTTFTLDLSRNGVGGYSGIEAITVHNNSLFATNSSTISEVYQRISDGNWITLGSAIEPGSPVRSLASYNGNLYAGTGASNHAKVWRWTGANWILLVDFQTAFGTTADGVLSLEVANGKLFAGLSGAPSYVFSYDGTGWTKSFELIGCARSSLSVIDGNIWSGFVWPSTSSCYGQVYQLIGNTWTDMGSLGDTAQSDFTDFVKYNNLLFGSTVGSGKIYYTSIDTIAPTVASHTLQASYTGTGPTSFTVTFSENVSDTGGGTLIDDVTNVNNYKIINKGTNGTLETTACNVSLGGDDSLVLPSNVVYAPNTAIVNLGSTLSNGSYRLFVCGTTSVLDLASNPLNGGVDFTFDFTVGVTATASSVTTTTSASSLPKTGFVPNKVTSLSAQPATLAYAELGDLWLEIPSLNLKSTIVGIPQNKDKTWDVTWLGNDTGWLNGTAFPTWTGNSVLTAHVTNASGLEGPFAALKQLKYGDQIIVHMGGTRYIYEVRTSRLARPYSTNYAFESKQNASYLTLITCAGYNPLNESYLFRRVVRAVLIEVK